MLGVKDLRMWCKELFEMIGQDFYFLLSAFAQQKSGFQRGRGIDFLEKIQRVTVLSD